MKSTTLTSKTRFFSVLLLMSSLALAPVFVERTAAQYWTSDTASQAQDAGLDQSSLGGGSGSSGGSSGPTTRPNNNPNTNSGGSGVGTQVKDVSDTKTGNTSPNTGGTGGNDRDDDPFGDSGGDSGSNDSGSQKPSLSPAEVARIVSQNASAAVERVQSLIGSVSKTLLEKATTAAINALESMGYPIIGDGSYTELDGLTPPVNPVVSNTVGRDPVQTDDTPDSDKKVEADKASRLPKLPEVTIDVLDSNGEVILSGVDPKNPIVAGPGTQLRINVDGTDAARLAGHNTGKAFDPTKNDGKVATLQLIPTDLNTGKVLVLQTNVGDIPITVVSTEDSNADLNDLQSKADKITKESNDRLTTIASRVGMSSIDEITRASGFDNPGITNTNSGAGSNDSLSSNNKTPIGAANSGDSGQNSGYQGSGIGSNDNDTVTGGTGQDSLAGGDGEDNLADDEPQTESSGGLLTRISTGLKGYYNSIFPSTETPTTDTTVAERLSSACGDNDCSPIDDAARTAAQNLQDICGSDCRVTVTGGGNDDADAYISAGGAADSIIRDYTLLKDENGIVIRAENGQAQYVAPDGTTYHRDGLDWAVKTPTGSNPTERFSSSGGGSGGTSRPTTIPQATLDTITATEAKAAELEATANDQTLPSYIRDAAREEAEILRGEADAARGKYTGTYEATGASNNQYVDTSSIDGITRASGFDDPGITNPDYNSNSGTRYPEWTESWLGDDGEYSGTYKLDQRIVDSMIREADAEARVSSLEKAVTISNDMDTQRDLAAAREKLATTRIETQKIRGQLDETRDAATKANTGFLQKVSSAVNLGFNYLIGGSSVDLTQGAKNDLGIDISNDPEEIARLAAEFRINAAFGVQDDAAATLAEAQNKLAAAQARGDAIAVRAAEEQLADARKIKEAADVYIEEVVAEQNTQLGYVDTNNTVATEKTDTSLLKRFSNWVWSGTNDKGETVEYRPATLSSSIEAARDNIETMESALNTRKEIFGNNPTEAEQAIIDRGEEALQKAKDEFNDSLPSYDGIDGNEEATFTSNYEDIHEKLKPAIRAVEVADKVIENDPTSLGLPIPDRQLTGTEVANELIAEGDNQSAIEDRLLELILEGQVVTRNLTEDGMLPQMVLGTPEDPYVVMDTSIVFQNRVLEALGLDPVGRTEWTNFIDNTDLVHRANCRGAGCADPEGDTVSFVTFPDTAQKLTADDRVRETLALSGEYATILCRDGCDADEYIKNPLSVKIFTADGRLLAPQSEAIRQDRSLQPSTGAHEDDPLYRDGSHGLAGKRDLSESGYSLEEVLAMLDEESAADPYRIASKAGAPPTEPEDTTLADRIAELPREAAGTLGNIAQWLIDKIPGISTAGVDVGSGDMVGVPFTLNNINEGRVRSIVRGWKDHPEFVNLLEEEMQRQGLDQDLLPILVAQMGAESAFNPNIVSSKNASGLMQVTPGSARTNCGSIGRCDEIRNMTDSQLISYLKDPKINVEFGLAEFSNRLEATGGDVTQTLAGYNGGGSLGTPGTYDDGSYRKGALNDSNDCPGSTQWECGINPGGYVETQQYVSIIGSAEDEIRKEMGLAGSETETSSGGNIVTNILNRFGLTDIAEEALPALEEQSKVKTVDEAVEVNATRKAKLEAEEKDMPRMMHVYSPETIKERYDDIDKTREVVEVTDSMVNNLNSAIGRAEAERNEMERIWLEDVLSGRDTLRPEVVEAVDSAYRAVSLLETMRDEAIIAAANEDVINTVATQGDANKYSDAVNTLMNAVSDTSISVADIAAAHGGDTLGGFANMTNGTIFSTPGDGRPGRLHDGYDYGTGRGDPWVASPVAGTITSCSGDGGGLAGGTCNLVPDDPVKDCDGARTCVIQIMHVEGIVAPNTHVEAGEIIANTGGDRSTLWGLVTILAERQAGRELTPEERDLAAWEIYDQNGGVLTNELKSQFAREGLSNAYSGNPVGENITPPHPHVQVRVDGRLLKGAIESDRNRLENIFGVQKGSLSSIDRVVPFPTLDALVRNAEVAPDEQAAIAARDARKVLSSDNSTLEIIETNAKNAISLMNEAHNVYNNEYVGQIEQTPERDQKVAKLTAEAKALADRNQELLRQADAESKLATINPAGSPRSGGSGGTSQRTPTTQYPGDDTSDRQDSQPPKNDVQTIVGGNNTMAEIPDYNLPPNYDDYIIGDLLGGYGDDVLTGSEGDDLMYSIGDGVSIPTYGDLGSESPLFFYNITPSESAGTNGADSAYTIIAPGLTDRGESYSELGNTLALYGTDGINTEQPKDSIFSRLFSNNSEFTPEDVQRVSYTYKPGDTQYSGVLEYVVTLADGSTQTFKISEASLLSDAEIRIENAGCRGEACIALLSRAEYRGAVGVADGDNRTSARTASYTRESWWQRFTEAMQGLNPLKKDEESVETYTEFDLLET